MIARFINQLLGVKTKSLEERLTNAIRDDVIQEIPFKELLALTIKEGLTISEKRKEDYCLSPLRARAKYGSGPDDYWAVNKFPDGRQYLNVIYLDAPVGIALLYQGWPNAITSISCPNNKTLMINQIQGIRAKIIDENTNRLIRKIHSRGLIPLNWEELLVRSVEYVAREIQALNLAIQSYSNNNWKSSIPIDMGEKRYDAVAEELGFARRKDGNWYKKVR